jgi:asparagine synthase (glutamine-hydrolysing)
MAAEGLQQLDTQAALAACKQGIDSQRLAITALESQWFMRNQLLRDADWAGMAHSLELRVPFVDTTLLDSFIEIPSLSPAQEKAMIARTVAPELPEAILNRPKTGFAVPIHQWLNPGVHHSINSHREWAGMLYQEFTQRQG